MRKRFILMAALLALPLNATRTVVQAESCPDVRIVFARGSGEPPNTNVNFAEFREAIEEKIRTTKLSYEFWDLDYPAVAADNLKTLAGAAISAGEGYTFGESVKIGTQNLVKIINGTACPNTKYVAGGYSQGAMVVAKSLNYLNPGRVIYAATFGDPKIYLPEGKGLVPTACSGKNLSDYRMYVPDCRAYKGLLGAIIPYRPEKLSGKVGTWCNKADVMCSSGISLSDHVNYITDDVYEDASRVIFDKIAQFFGIDNKYSSPHDTAILIDSSSSMAKYIDDFRAEALKIAEQTFAIGGRVALIDYRDLDDPYEPVMRCDFENCTLELITNYLDRMKFYNGGDDPESLLSASYFTMQNLKWRLGATKSLVVLTDANFLKPDRDGMTLERVVALSKSIDPVNFYIVTLPKMVDEYQELAALTDGKVIPLSYEPSDLADYIINRYDSLPRVNENDEELIEPTLIIESVDYISSNEVKIKFGGEAEKIIVTLNDAVLGMTAEKEITIYDLDLSRENHLSFIPTNDHKGEPVELILEIKKDAATDQTSEELDTIIPKAPNTGKFD